MKTIVLTATALFLAAGSAFAGSDHFNANYDQQPAVTQGVDNTTTASVNAGSQDHVKIEKQVTDGTPRLGGNS